TLRIGCKTNCANPGPLILSHYKSRLDAVLQVTGESIVNLAAVDRISTFLGYEQAKQLRGFTHVRRIARVRLFTQLSDMGSDIPNQIGFDARCAPRTGGRKCGVFEMHRYELPFPRIKAAQFALGGSSVHSARGSSRLTYA